MLKIISSLWSGAIAGTLLAFCLQVLLARTLEPIEFGYLVGALAISNAAAPMATMGIAGFWPKVFGEEGNTARRWLPATLKYNLVSSIAIYLVLLLWTFLGPHSTHQIIFLAITSFHIFGYVAFEAIITSLQIRRQYTLLSWWQIFPHLLRLVFFLPPLIYFTSGIGVSAAFAYAATALVGVLLLPKYIKPLFEKYTLQQSVPCDKSTSKSIRETLNHSWPYGASSLLYLLYLQLPIIFATYLIDSIAAGYIGIVVSILSAAYILPSSLFQRVLLVRIHEYANTAPHRLHALLRYGVRWMFFLGLAFSLIIIFGSDYLINFAFGVEYAPVSSLLAIASVSLPFRFMSLPYDAVLSTRTYIYSKLAITTCITIALAALSTVLVSTHGSFGIVLAIITIDIINCLLFRQRASTLLKELVITKARSNI